MHIPEPRARELRNYEVRLTYCNLKLTTTHQEELQIRCHSSIKMASDDEQYHPKDAVKSSVQASMVTGGAGLLIAAISNSLSKRNVGAWSVFTRGSGTIAAFTAAGGAYVFSRDAMANLREKDDAINFAVGGFFGGAVMGLRSLRTPTVLGLGAATAVALGAFEFTGSSLRGGAKDKDRDEFEYKEYLRKNRRIPIEETIAQIGEGRGIHAPGYDERRQQRIKENYGIDVPAKSTHTPS
ncbi:NADH-ubiquinone oxidoreductase subunit [Amylocarpus encephaloides]|uniref:NADH-ubiquinone oxidoreductase subunit n=1 Tax=Amylocarpus encephaloides TaxID=45428 RepID=A0A9P8C1C7_9HELO|nr:NADH-ubiquinone oxidoreductase subunit [Amylocarpus encephaloides]